MSSAFIHLIVIYILIAAFLIARPWLSGNNVLFGVVFGSGEIRKNPDVKKLVGRFVALCAAIAAVLGIAFWLILQTTPMDGGMTAYLFTVSVLILIVLETIPYILANRSLKRIKETIWDENLVRDRITIEIGGEASKKPVSAAWFLLLLAPVVITIVITWTYYPSMPDRIPTHFGINGAADAWGTKSAGLVMVPVTAQIVIAAIMFLIGVFSRNAAASVKGSPGAAPRYAAFRRFLSFWIIAFGLIIQAGIMIPALQMVGAVQNAAAWPAVFLGLIALFVVILMVVFFRMRGEPTGRVYDDDSVWVLGMFYYNPSDPSIFVEKRNGIGRTINFGRPAAWIIIVAIVLFIIFAKNLPQK